MDSLVSTLDPGQLARAFELRPDLLIPRPPANVHDLTQRVATATSVAQAVAGCDWWCRQLIEVALVLRGPTSASAMASLIRTAAGVLATEEQVERGVGRVADRLLFFVDGERRIWLNPGLVSLVPRPCGLGPPVGELLAGLTATELRRMADAACADSAGRQTKAEAVAALSDALADHGTVARLLAEAPRESVELLREADMSYVNLPYPGWSRSSRASRTTDAYAWLLDRALIVERLPGYGYGQAEVPREVAIAVRGGVAIVAGLPDPPSLATVRAGEPAELDRRAAARAGATVRSVTRLLGVLGETPAMPLKDGGIGTRECGRLAKALDLSQEEAFVVLEVAAAAGLVSPSCYEPVVPSTAADDGWTRPQPFAGCTSHAPGSTRRASPRSPVARLRTTRSSPVS